MGLERFVEAQAEVYPIVLAELRAAAGILAIAAVAALAGGGCRQRPLRLSLGLESLARCRILRPA